ncbi:hypothetical protein FDP41_004985 [Naegleria fowleri]|uniref:Uncharacterized protein n=1 Tax=Naegleria fowleri TaxID=5763 RepID=A0A6A5BND3_NAEFO|nr:uncharacterized protein FDP41_004985 [Naegleria fowleri]KAF0975658.1 hypothetical protein FDP41_004985 [Naegleria fowleri]
MALYVNGMPSDDHASSVVSSESSLDCAFLKLNTGSSRTITSSSIPIMFHNISCNALPIPTSSFSPFTVRITGGIDAIFAHASPMIMSSSEYSFCASTRRWLDQQQSQQQPSQQQQRVAPITTTSTTTTTTSAAPDSHHHENSYRKRNLELSIPRKSQQHEQQQQPTLSQLNNLCSQLFCRPTDLTIQEVFQNFSKASMDGSFFPTSITTDFSVKLILEESESGNNLTKRYLVNLNHLVSLYNYCQYCEQENPSFELYHQEKYSGICTLNFSYNVLFGGGNNLVETHSLAHSNHNNNENSESMLLKQVSYSSTTISSSATSSTDASDACGDNGFSLPLLNVMIYASLVSESTLQYYFPVRMCYCYKSESFSSKCDDWSTTYYREPFQNGIRSIFITLYIVELIVIILMVLLPLEFKHVMGWNSSQKLKLAKELAKRKQNPFHHDHVLTHNNTDSLTDNSNYSIDENSSDAGIHGDESTSGNPTPAMETSFRLDDSNIRKYTTKKSNVNRARTRSRGLSSLSDSLLLNSHLHSDPSPPQANNTTATNTTSPASPRQQLSHTTVDPVPPSSHNEETTCLHTRAVPHYCTAHEKHETDEDLTHVSLASERIYSSKKTKTSRVKQALISITKSIADFRIIATLISICNLVLGFISLISVLPYDARLVLISVDCILSLMGLIPIVFQWLVVLRSMESKDSISQKSSASNNIKLLSLFVFLCTLFLFIGYVLTVLFVTGYSRVLLARYIMMVVLFLYFITIFPLLVIYGVKVYFRILRENKEIRFFQFKFTKYLIFESITYLYFTFYTIYFMVSYPYFLFTFYNIGDRFMTVYPWVITHIFILLSYCNRFYFLSDWFCIKQFYSTLFTSCFGFCHSKGGKKEVLHEDTSTFYQHHHENKVHAARKSSDASNSSSPHQQRHVCDNDDSTYSFNHNEDSIECKYSTHQN